MVRLLVLVVRIGFGCGEVIGFGSEDCWTLWQVDVVLENAGYLLLFDRFSFYHVWLSFFSSMSSSVLASGVLYILLVDLDIDAEL